MRNAVTLLLVLFLLTLSGCESGRGSGAAATTSPGSATNTVATAAPADGGPATETPAGYPAPDNVVPTSLPDGYPAPTEPTTAAQPDGYPAPDSGGQSEVYPTRPAPPPPPSDGGAVELSVTCDYAYQPYFTPLLAAQPDLLNRLGCPTGPANQVWAIWQSFENDNFMLWLESYSAIIATFNDQWHGYPSTYRAGDPDLPAGAPVPAAPERVQPIRQLGYAWLPIADQIGFATGNEGGYYADVQPLENGWLLRSPLGPLIVLSNMESPQLGSGDFSAWIRSGDSWIEQ